MDVMVLFHVKVAVEVDGLVVSYLLVLVDVHVKVGIGVEVDALVLLC